MKPTKKFPQGGCFYCDSEDEDLVKAHTWHSIQTSLKASIYVEAIDYLGQHLIHRELAFKYLGYYPKYIDHINGVGFDNVDRNLNIVTSQQNIYNSPTKGYRFDPRYNSFFSRISYKKDTLIPFEVVKTEIEACQLQYLTETVYLKPKMQEDYYMYDFLKDRRKDLDILDLERTKKISSEEAVYRHVVRYAKDNAWYFYRYNLTEYFRDNHISIPSYDLDNQGFMIDKVTRKQLCPFN